MNASPRIVTMRLDRTFLLGALLGAAALSACNSAKPVGGAPPTATCLKCHGGTDNATGAPPAALDGTTTARAVGAHTVHLGTDVQCLDCHVVPSLPGDAGHRTRPDGSADTDNQRAEVTFGERARHSGFAPTYDRASYTCSNVYCHQSFFGGQGPVAPVWDVPFTGGACQNCHGAPPSNHPQTLTLLDCATCHASSVTDTGTILAGGTHLDGQVNAPQGCTGCHGDEARATNKPAPPLDTAGLSDSPQVGAHQAHLVAGRLRTAMRCTECHEVPTSPAHSNGVTEVPFATEAGTIAANGGLTPAFDPATGTCSNVYCHGGSLAGGSNTTPVFSGGPAEIGIGGTTPVETCGVCHGFPPTGAHPPTDTTGAPFTSKAQCNQCHPTTVDAAGEIQVGFHINGTLDGGGGHAAGFSNPAVHGPIALGALQSCKACHGADFGAVVNSSTTPGKSCNACHANPAAFGLTGYGTHPAWQTECTFCHGDANRAADASFPDVGSPPIKANKAGPPVVTGKHLVGTVGASAGAHQAHYDAATNEYSLPLVCTNCHGSPLPANLDHVVGTVVASWGPLPQTDGVVPAPAAFTTTWEGTPTCTNYCHGATLPGGTRKSPRWDDGPAGTSCGSCHAVPVPYTAAGGFHVPNPDCGKCHPGYTAGSVNKVTHVDGERTLVPLSCVSCHGAAGAGNEAPPNDASGATTGVRVGAHQAHLTKTALRSQPLVCVDCHGTKPAPGQFDHKNGVINIGFNALANTGLPSPVFNTAIAPVAFDAAWEATPTCTNYCHGATLAGGLNNTPIWTGGPIQATCGSCHAVPLPYSAEGKWHVQNDACGACHTGYTNGSVVTATHIDGSPTRVNLTCATCHTPPVSQTPFVAPFRATTGATANTDLRVGAHARHLTTAITAAITCTDCHNQASSAPHANGAVNIAWGSRAGAAATPPGPTIPTGGAVTCANACHGQGLPAATGPNRTPGWSGTTLTGCTGCHRTPGEGEHRYRRFDTDGTSSNGPHASLPCTACHYAVNSTNSNTTITNPALHINGVRDVQINPGFLGTGGSATKTGNTWTCAVACHSGDPESAAGW